MPSLNFNPSTDIPDLSGKVIVITGATNGLGYETALSFAGQGPAHIYFSGRSQPSADKLIKEVKAKFPKVGITFIKCDLASLDSVQNAAKQLLNKTDKIDTLMLNAGVMALPHGQTKDGYEIQFGTNHVGHALLAKLLAPAIEATAKKTGDVRIVWNTSLGYELHPKGGILFDRVKTPQRDISLLGGRWIRYGQSKLANLLYARSFAKHHPTIKSISIHPGVSATGLVTSLGIADRVLVYVTNIGKMLSAEQCAWNQQWAATAPAVESGCFYEPVGVKGRLNGDAGNDELAERLWEWTQKELDGYSI